MNIWAIFLSILLILTFILILITIISCCIIAKKADEQIELLKKE